MMISKKKKKKKILLEDKHVALRLNVFHILVHKDQIDHYLVRKLIWKGNFGFLSSWLLTGSDGLNPLWLPFSTTIV